MEAVEVWDEQTAHPPEATEPVAKVKKEKPPIRVVKYRGRKSEELRSKKMITEYEGKFRVQFPEEDREKFEVELLAVPEMRFERRAPYDPDGNTPFDQLTYVLIYSVRQSEETLQLVAKFGRAHKFVFDSDLSIRAHASTEEGKELEKLSYAKNATLDLPKLRGKLMPFQKAGVQYALRAKRTFIADEMGLGKTMQALATAHAVGRFPWLIITPASLKYNWFKELRKWMPKHTKISFTHNHDLELTSKGNITKASKEYLTAFDFYIVNYDRLKKWSKFLESVEWVGIIMDESHYVKGRSDRSRAAKHLFEATTPEYQLLLTGTPLMNNPVEIISQLNIMGRLNDFGGYNNFKMRYCTVSSSDASHMSRIAEDAQRKLDIAEGATLTQVEEGRVSADDLKSAMIRKLYENMTALNSRLRSICYVRREKKAVLTDLPDKQRTMLPLAITNRKTYEYIEQDVVSYLGEQAVNDEKFLLSIKKLKPQEKLDAIRERRASKEYKSARAEALVKIETLKMCAATGKLKAAKEWIHNFLESGQKLVVFAHHVRIIEELLDEFPNAAHTQGNDEKRNAAVERFQTDPKCNLFIGSLKRDGVGITLHAASSTAFLELGWNPAVHDQAEDRVHRIGQRDAVTAYYLLAARTIEEKIAQLIERKRQMVNAVADGDPLKGMEQGSILGEILETYTKKSSLLQDSKTMEELEPVKMVFPKKKKGTRSIAKVAKTIKKYAKAAKAKKAARRK
jgi:SNF2 family DNA or RNA helicase